MQKDINGVKFLILQIYIVTQLKWIYLYTCTSMYTLFK